MKNKKRYVCNICGYTSSTWIGKCPECLNWNCLIEEIIESQKSTGIKKKKKELINVDHITSDTEFFLPSSVSEINNFFGDGIVAGSTILITGEPGIGKSTFLLYLAKSFTPGITIFYYSGEESQKQIKKRCDRLNVSNLDLFISNEVDVDLIIEECKHKKPGIIYIDSIQTCYSTNIDSSAGTVSQIKKCTAALIRYAKEHSVPLIIVGHITKAGDIAGPKLMEHMVDVVMHFEADALHHYRILRSIKNRFGSIDEILLFEMKEKGLELIENPSGYFIDKDENNEVIGKCKTVIIEGRRPLIIEVEALAVASSYSIPRRIAEGVDVSRINRITAILEKHLNERFNTYDIYFNISGGVKTKDVGIDLAAAIAIYSSKKKLHVNNAMIFFGELSLTGKIRSVKKIEQRINEAIKFGSNTIICPKINYNTNNTVSLKQVDSISAAITQSFTS